jgi:hypothetical protein
MPVCATLFSRPSLNKAESLQQKSRPEKVVAIGAEQPCRGDIASGIRVIRDCPSLEGLQRQTLNGECPLPDGDLSFGARD